MIIRPTFPKSTFGSEFLWPRGDEWAKRINQSTSCQESPVILHGTPWGPRSDQKARVSHLRRTGESLPLHWQWVVADRDNRGTS